MALLTSPQSPLTSALQGFAGDGRGGILAGLAPMLPMLLGQGAAQLREMAAEEIDGALLFVAEACLAARSVDAAPGAVVAVERDGGVFLAPLGNASERAPHNED